MQQESEAPLVAIRDMVNKLQAYMIPTGAREEVELSAGAEMHNERTPWAAESLSLKHDCLTLKSSRQDGRTVHQYLILIYVIIVWQINAAILSWNFLALWLDKPEYIFWPPPLDLELVLRQD